MKRLGTLLAGLAIFLLNLWLNWPLFLPGDLPFRGSIERGYVGMARFVAAHPNPWGWNPLPYCGLPTQFMYVPGLPYVTALFLKLLPHAAPDTVYRILVSLAACLGPVVLFYFALYFTGSRKWSFGMALGYSFISLSYALFPAVEKDRGIVQLPWRIQVLAKYGEGPHVTGLALLPLALLALWLAAKGRSYGRILAAAMLLSVIPLVNWVAAMSLAISCVLLLVAAFGEAEFAAWRALAAAGLAYLLACFWLTPSFIRTIAFNWPVDSFAYHFGVQQAWLLAGMAAGVAAIRILFRVFRGSFYLCFTTLGAFAFGWIATAFYVYGLDTIPESRRYAIEFELFAALALVEGLRLAMRSANSTVRLCAIGSAGVMLLIGAPQIWAYCTQGWHVWMPEPPAQTVEYRLADWMEQHKPQGRVFASGGMRFRLDSWFDLPQVGGGFETGLQNRTPVDLAYRIRAAKLRAGHESEDTITLLKALDAQYVVVHGEKSREYYHDFVRPERVASLPVVYRTEDDTIYSLPPQSIAHVLRPEELPDGEAREHPEMLARFVAAIDDASRPQLDVRWTDAGRIAIGGAAPAGSVVEVQVNAGPGWQAAQDGHTIPVTKDGLGFLVLHPSAAAATRIDLSYRGTTEQRVMAGLSAVAWILAIGAWWRSRTARKKDLWVN